MDAWERLQAAMSSLPTPVVRVVGPFRLIDWITDGERTASFSLGPVTLAAKTSSIYAERELTVGVGVTRTLWIRWRS